MPPSASIARGLSSILVIASGSPSSPKISSRDLIVSSTERNSFSGLNDCQSVLEGRIVRRRRVVGTERLP